MTRAQLERPDRFVEFVAVMLLGVATLGSAWCGYQASRWNGEEGRREAAASDERIEASRLFTLAAQQVTYDSVIVSQYAQAVNADDVSLQQFYLDTLVRSQFLPVIERYTAQIQAGEPPTRLLEDEAYLDELFAGYYEAEGRAEATMESSHDAGTNADDFVLLTVLFASALFFAGVTTSFRASAEDAVDLRRSSRSRTRARLISCRWPRTMRVCQTRHDRSERAAEPPPASASDLDVLSGPLATRSLAAPVRRGQDRAASGDPRAALAAAIRRRPLAGIAPLPQRGARPQERGGP
jgi:hypothetical protein